MRSSIFGGKWLTAIAVGILLTISSALALAESTFVNPDSLAAKKEACVAPTEDIRRNHMDYLKHGRDDVVRDGIRISRFQLHGCIACHASVEESGNYRPVDEEGEFCSSCHEYAAVSLACFQCHRTTPEPASAELGEVDMDRAIRQLNGATVFNPTLHSPAAVQRD
jgi:hypothetical protein